MERCWLDRGTVGDGGGRSFCLIHGLSTISTLSRISTCFRDYCVSRCVHIYMGTKGKMRIQPAREYIAAATVPRSRANTYSYLYKVKWAIPQQNLAGTIMVLAGCWPNNALGEPELAYCLSAGHLLGGAFVLQLQPRYLCVPESASVFSWALTPPFYKCKHNK